MISFSPPFPGVIAGLVLMGFGGGFYEASLTGVISHVSPRNAPCEYFHRGSTVRKQSIYEHLICILWGRFLQSICNASTNI